MNAKMIALLLVLLIPGAVFCLDYRVDYVYGTVEVRADGHWQPAEIGSVIPGNSSLRIAPGGVAELSS